MPDREKVIKGLECHAEVNCVECPYRDGWRTCPFGETLLSDVLAADALTLLKEQETTDTNDLRVFHCKKCGYGIEDIFISDEHNYSLVPKFCPNCGRRVGEANA